MDLKLIWKKQSCHATVLHFQNILCAWLFVFTIQGLLPRGEKPNPLREKNSRVNQLLRSWLPRLPGVQLLDFDFGFVHSDGTISRNDMFDFLHLTAIGYAKICRPLHELIMQLLEETPEEKEVTLAWSSRHSSCCQCYIIGCPPPSLTTIASAVHLHAQCIYTCSNPTSANPLFCLLYYWSPNIIEASPVESELQDWDMDFWRWQWWDTKNHRVM